MNELIFGRIGFNGSVDVGIGMCVRSLGYGGSSGDSFDGGKC